MQSSPRSFRMLWCKCIPSIENFMLMQCQQLQHDEDTNVAPRPCHIRQGCSVQTSCMDTTTTLQPPPGARLCPSPNACVYPDYRLVYICHLRLQCACAGSQGCFHPRKYLPDCHGLGGSHAATGCTSSTPAKSTTAACLNHPASSVSCAVKSANSTSTAYAANCAGVAFTTHRGAASSSIAS
jgi:hypothetical protein